MASNTKAMRQHARLAQGDKVGFRKGGRVSVVPQQTNLMSSGKPTSPLTDAKRANGIPGYKKGGMKGC